MAWVPKRSLHQTDTILCAPGALHETETRLIEGRLYRVYKNLSSSMREFWLSAVKQYSNDTYIVYQTQRLTYNQVHLRAAHTADVLVRKYGVQKGDRVGICSRNCPDYLVVFWACHLIGAVAVLANAWLPVDMLRHCLANTQCKVIVSDPERAEILSPIISKVYEESTCVAFLVYDLQVGGGRWPRMQSFQEALDSLPKRDIEEFLDSCPEVGPEDDATVIFTSGTTGIPKGVLSTQRQYLTNVLNVKLLNLREGRFADCNQILAGGSRAALRRGEDYPQLQREGPQKGILVTVPLFHVTGSTSFSMMATMTGMKIILTRKWVTEEAVRLIKTENIAVAGGVPVMVSDLVDSSLAGYPLEGLLFGGAPAPDSLVPRARKAFPSATMIQGYGLTETNSISVSFAGEDYTMRPTSTGRACPVNDIQVVHDGVCLPPGGVGEVWIRGPNVMKGYWRDPVNTKKVITDDGWLKSGDLGYMDDEGFLYIKDRLKDLIIRGGENIDSVTVENAIYADPRVSEAAAVGVPDERLGELVAAIVYIKPVYRGTVTEAGLISEARKSLPKFAVPVMIVIVDEPFPHTPSGKIVKGDLRQIAAREWESRRRSGAVRERLVNL